MGIGIILDLIILFALVGGVLWNMRRGFLRALIGLIMLFLAMTVAAMLGFPWRPRAAEGQVSDHAESF